MFAMSLQRSSILYHIYTVYSKRRSRCKHHFSVLDVKVEDWWKGKVTVPKVGCLMICPVNPFCGRTNSPFNRPQHPSADWSAHAFATAKQISLHWHVVPFFSYKHQTWIIRLLMSPEVVSKASKAAKAMLGMSWLADKSQGGRGRASKRRDI